MARSQMAEEESDNRAASAYGGQAREVPVVRPEAEESTLEGREQQVPPLPPNAHGERSERRPRTVQPGQDAAEVTVLQHRQVQCTPAPERIEAREASYTNLKSSE